MSSRWVPGVVALVALAACGRIGFGAASGDGGGGGDDDGSGSGSGSGSGMDLSGTCLSPGYGDGFDEVVPCKAFGMVQASNGGLNVMNSQLTLTPNASTASNLGCQRISGAFGAAGTFIEVSQVLPDPGETVLEITGTTTGFTASIVISGGELGYFDSIGTFEMLPYDPVAYRWWRIRPASGKLLAETSPDGKAWHTFASANAPMVPPEVAIAAFVQTDDTNTAPGVAVFQGIDVCPP